MFPATHIHLLTVRFQDSSVIKHLALLTLVPGDELDPFTRTHLVYSIICYVYDLPHIVEIRSRIEVMRVPRLGER